MCFVIALIWLISIVSAIPFIPLTTFKQAFHAKYHRNVSVCYTEFKTSFQKSYLFVILIGFYAIPCILLFFQYGRIICIVRKMHICKFQVTYVDSHKNESEIKNQNNKSEITKIDNNNNNNADAPLLLASFKTNSESNINIKKKKCSIVRLRSPNKIHKQTTIMLFVMMIIFFICILPYRIFAIWAVYADQEDFQKLGIEKYYIILTLVRVMFYLNSAINPILYHILSIKFQTAFKRSMNCFNRPEKNLFLR